MINADVSHELIWKKMRPILSDRTGKDFSVWKEEIRQKLIELTGLDKIAKNECPVNVQILWEKEEPTYRMIRFTFDSEVGQTIPCYLLIPKTGKAKYPVAITVQGHSSGAYNSIGEIRAEEDKNYQPRGAFALQAVENGFIALAIEQRGMGDLKPSRPNRGSNMNCQYATSVAFLLGRTMIGERIWDMHKAIDALASFAECDLDKIMITGSSGGGTTSYYAACYDERIKLSAPSCSFCPYPESILDIWHCSCNYIPSAYQWFDMQDLSVLIAPRRLLVVTGKEDDIFPIEGVERGFATVKEIYQEAGAADNCRLITTPKGHYWCMDIMWPAILEETKKLGWEL
ncbi:MAG: acetylxylan esterase [Clostridia bacterium]|nr:acetylxylan esterase [Clostridia bacterium]